MWNLLCYNPFHWDFPECIGSFIFHLGFKYCFVCMFFHQSSKCWLRSPGLAFSLCFPFQAIFIQFLDWPLIVNQLLKFYKFHQSILFFSLIMQFAFWAANFDIFAFLNIALHIKKQYWSGAQSILLSFNKILPFYWCFSLNSKHWSLKLTSVLTFRFFFIEFLDATWVSTFFYSWAVLL